MSAESDTNAFYNRLEKARQLSAPAAQSALHAEPQETAALCLLNSTLREGEVGNTARVRDDVKRALAIASSRDAEILSAPTLACTGRR